MINVNNDFLKMRKTKLIYIIFLFTTMFLFCFLSCDNKEKRYNKNVEKEEKAFIEAINSNNDSVLKNYLRNHSKFFVIQDGRSNIDHYDIILNLLFENSKKKGFEIMYSNKSLWESDSLKAQYLDSIIEAEYNKIKGRNTLEDWDKFISVVNPGDRRGADSLLNVLEEKLWKNEITAWQMTNYRNSLDYHVNFLTKYSKSNNSKYAYKWIVDTLNSKHDRPFLKEAEDFVSALSEVLINNFSSDSLYFYPDILTDQFILLLPNSSNIYKLPNGIYSYKVESKRDKIKSKMDHAKLNGELYILDFFIESPAIKTRKQLDELNKRKVNRSVQ